MKTIYEDLSEERKRLQEEGVLPDWFTTAGWQLFSSKYATKAEKDFKSVARRISKCAAKWTDDPEYWEPKFYTVIWNGWLSCATPILANMGTDRGCNVSCSGNFVNDCVYDFYDTQKEIAMLSKNGFGTSSYLGAIRHRGTEISSGGKASGVLPVLKDFVQLSRDISQGNTRRGAWAGYIEIDHEDFWEIINFLNSSPDDCNIGWVITDKFIRRLNSGDKKAISRYQKVMKTKMVTGKGYFFFVDKVNKLTPKCYKDNGLKVKASNLCVTGNTLVQVKIEDESSEEFVLPIKLVGLFLDNGIPLLTKSFNVESNKIEWKKIVDFALTKKDAKLIKITDETSGKSLVCTPCHLIYTKNRGYVEAGNLTTSDELKIL